MTKLKLTFAFGALLVVAIALVLPGQQQNWTTLNNGTTGTTQAVGDNSTKLATTAYVDQNQNAPAWATWLGDGSEGAGNCSTTLQGEHWYTTFTVSGGNTCTSNINNTLVIRATGTCTIAGTINARGVDLTNSSSIAIGGAAGGGSGGGAAAGASGSSVTVNWASGGGGVGLLSGGNAGASSGGNGFNGSTPAVTGQGYQEV